MIVNAFHLSLGINKSGGNGAATALNLRYAVLTGVGIYHGKLVRVIC